MTFLSLISNIDHNKETIYDNIKQYLESFCLENNINKERQDYKIMFCEEQYSSNTSLTYRVGFQKSLCFYGKFYILPPEKEYFLKGEEVIEISPNPGDLIIGFGSITNKTVTDKQASTLEFYIGSSSSLRGFDLSQWLPI
jgi:hypothetical protein